MGDQRQSRESFSSEGFGTGFWVPAPPERAYAAIIDPRAWWMRHIDGESASVGSEFGYVVEGVHRVRMRVEELVPGTRVSWRVIENWMSFIEDQAEWVGTLIRFELSARDGGTDVSFTHEGLKPHYECFDVCVDAWDLYARRSLRDLILTGRGTPSSGETAVHDVEVSSQPS
jgi:uncharacterized protein YndB with AHSA1/START domain